MESQVMPEIKFKRRGCPSIDLMVLQNGIGSAGLGANHDGLYGFRKERYFIGDGLTCRAAIHIEAVGQDEPCGSVWHIVEGGVLV